MRPSRSRRHWRREEGRATDELLDTPAARVLRHIVRTGPVNMRRFTEVSGHAPRHAKILREKMEERGWLEVRDVAVRPTTTDMEIHATAEGRRIAEASIAMEEAGERAKRRRG